MLLSNAPAVSAEFKKATEAFNAKYERRVLLCLLGETPAVITETLSLLLKEGIETGGIAHAFQPTEIRIITTGDVARSLETSIAGKSLLTTWLPECLTSWHLAVPKKIPISIYLIRDSKPPNTVGEIKDYGLYSLTYFNRPDSKILTAENHKNDPFARIPTSYAAEGMGDVRTTLETKHTANFLLEQMTELCSDNDCAIHTSIAGGRKSMGALLTQVMSLIGREDDTISHVLVHKELESKDTEIGQIPKREKWLALQPWLKPSDNNNYNDGTHRGHEIFKLSSIEYIRLSKVHKATVIDIGKNNEKRMERYDELVCRVQGIMSGDLTYRAVDKGKFYLGNYHIELGPEPQAFLGLLVAQTGLILDFENQASDVKGFLAAYFAALNACGATSYEKHFLSLANQEKLLARGEVSFGRSHLNPTSTESLAHWEFEKPVDTLHRILRSQCDMLNAELNAQHLGSVIEVGKVTKVNAFQVKLVGEHKNLVNVSAVPWLGKLSKLNAR